MAELATREIATLVYAGSSPVRRSNRPASAKSEAGFLLQAIFARTELEKLQFKSYVLPRMCVSLEKISLDYLVLLGYSGL